VKPSELIADPKKWIKGTLARDANGRPISPYSKEAVCFCIHGAKIACGIQNTREFEDRILNAMKEIYGCDFLTIVQFNDRPTTTH